MAESEKKSNQNLIIIVLVVILIILVGVVGFFVIKNMRGDSEGTPVVTEKVEAPKIAMAKGIIALNENNIQEQVDKMMAAAEAGQFILDYVPEAHSSDGINFDCYIGNSLANKGDIYLQIFKDITLEEQILLSGLIPVGSALGSFESEIKLEPGTYEAVLTLTEVDDAHEAIEAQVSVVINLIVE